jgi:hypothetical protein
MVNDVGGRPAPGRKGGFCRLRSSVVRTCRFPASGLYAAFFVKRHQRHFCAPKKLAPPIRWQGQGFRLDHSSRGTAHEIDSAYSAGLWLQAIPPRKITECDVSAPLSYRRKSFFFHAKVQGSGGSWIDPSFDLLPSAVGLQAVSRRRPFMGLPRARSIPNPCNVFGNGNRDDGHCDGNSYLLDDGHAENGSTAGRPGRHPEDQSARVYRGTRQCGCQSALGPGVARLLSVRAYANPACRGPPAQIARVRFRKDQ